MFILLPPGQSVAGLDTTETGYELCQCQHMFEFTSLMVAHTVEKTTQGMAKRPLKSQMAIMVETTHRFELRARSGHTMALYLKRGEAMQWDKQGA